MDLLTRRRRRTSASTYTSQDRRDRILYLRTWVSLTGGVEGCHRRRPELRGGRKMEETVQEEVVRLEHTERMNRVLTITQRAIFANEQRGIKGVNLSVRTQSNGSYANFQIFRT
jgi:hypothetical protein